MRGLIMGFSLSVNLSNLTNTPARDEVTRVDMAWEVVDFRNQVNNQSELVIRSRDWLSANQGPVVPDSVGSWLI